MYNFKSKLLLTNGKTLYNYQQQNLILKMKTIYNIYKWGEKQTMFANYRDLRTVEVNMQNRRDVPSFQFSRQCGRFVVPKRSYQSGVRSSIRIRQVATELRLLTFFGRNIVFRLRTKKYNTQIGKIYTYQVRYTYDRSKIFIGE